MPLPKHRLSSSRQGKRRTHKKLRVTHVSECGHCHQPKLPHQACANCGYYGERMVIVPQEG
jgi:large subunit ribosomal protein L32